MNEMSIKTETRKGRMKTTKYYLQNEEGIDWDGFLYPNIPLVCSLLETGLFLHFIAGWSEPKNLYEMLGQIVMFVLVGSIFLFFNYFVFRELTNKPYIEIKSK